MSTSGRPAIIDDGMIRQLAEEPERPLFPILRQAEAMVPLVIVLAFLPALYAVENRSLSEAGAWEGLVSLKCLAAGSLSEFIDPSALDGANPFRFQPPLMNWLTALSMKAFGTGHVAGVIAPAYLCTALLVVSGYLLGKRMGGERLGLVAAAMLALNPLVLEGAQEPLPQSATVMLAMLVLIAAVTHWQKSSAVTSYQLLLGGIALGLCLLAGGPVALTIVVVILVYVVCWKADAWLCSRRGIISDRNQFNRRTAFRSTAMLAATGFALGGWHAMLMSSRYGLEFWRGWMATGDVISIATGKADGGDGYFMTAWELHRLAMPVFSFTLVGVVGIVRDLYRAEEDPVKRHRGLLLVWSAVAWVLWIASGGSADSGSVGSRVWETLLAVPLILLAALGLIEIAQRRISFHLSLAFALLAFADAALLTDQWWARSALRDALWETGSVRHSTAGLTALLLLAACGVGLARFASRHDLRRRIVLNGMLLAIVAANCVGGALAVRRTHRGDRELEAMRSGLSRLTGVERCVFITLGPPDSMSRSPMSQAPMGQARPPAQLVYTLTTLWPQAAFGYETTWEQAVLSTGMGTRPDSSSATIYVVWSPRGKVRATAPATDLRLAAPPFLYRGYDVVAYGREPVSPTIFERY